MPKPNPIRHYTLNPDYTVKPVDMLEWARWFEKAKQKRVVKQQTVNGYLVSTVFLGLDHNFTAQGPPLIFETMVFPNKPRRSYAELYCDRYSTWDEAIVGHAKAVAAAKKEVFDKGD